MKSDRRGTLALALLQCSHDPEDTSTNTTLFIANVSKDVNEDILREEFGVHGHILSVKILRPQNEDDRGRPTTQAFVTYERVRTTMSHHTFLYSMLKATRR